MVEEHLQTCEMLPSGSITEKYWECTSANGFTAKCQALDDNINNFICIPVLLYTFQKSELFLSFTFLYILLQYRTTVITSKYVTRWANLLLSWSFPDNLWPHCRFRALHFTLKQFSNGTSNCPILYTVLVF